MGSKRKSQLLDLMKQVQDIVTLGQTMNRNPHAMLQDYRTTIESVEGDIVLFDQAVIAACPMIPMSQKVKPPNEKKSKRHQK